MAQHLHVTGFVLSWTGAVMFPILLVIWKRQVSIPQSTFLTEILLGMVVLAEIIGIFMVIFPFDKWFDL